MISHLDVLLLPFMELIAVCLLAGLVGAFAFLDRKIFFAESVTHGTFPGGILGVVIAATLGASHEQMSLALFIGAFLFCLPLGGLMRFIGGIPGISSQASAGIVLTFGFAMGYFLYRWFSPLPIQIQSFLTGSILTVNSWDVASAGAGLVVVLVIVAVWGKDLVFKSYDPIDSLTRGMNTRLLEGLSIAMVIGAIVLLIPAVGTVLSIALFAAPAAGLAPLVKSWPHFMVASPLVALGIGMVGFACGVVLNLSVGGMIAIVAGIFFAATRLIVWARCAQG